MTDAIQKAREELRGQLALLHSLANDTTEANWRDKRLYILQTCVRMSDALAALDAETEVKVKVRELEWYAPDPEDIQDSDDCVLMARGMGGRYSISARQLVCIPSPDNMGYLLWDADDAFSFTEHLTIEAAKAAAQADFERRIRSALVTPESRS